MFARDGADRLLHPRLHELWQSMESSSHLIFIEIGKQAKNASTKAGEMIIERVDPSGGQHTVNVQLFLSTVDRAFAEKRLPQGAEPFWPFAELFGSSRYAEVLGHELAHVERVFADPNYLRLYMEIDRELSSYCSRRKIRKGQVLDQEEQKHLQRIDFSVNEVEKPAAAAEAEIWRELIASEEGWGSTLLRAVMISRGSRVLRAQPVKYPEVHLTALGEIPFSRAMTAAVPATSPVLMHHGMSR